MLQPRGFYVQCFFLQEHAYKNIKAQIGLKSQNMLSKNLKKNSETGPLDQRYLCNQYFPTDIFAPPAGPYWCKPVFQCSYLNKNRYLFIAVIIRKFKTY